MQTVALLIAGLILVTPAVLIAQSVAGIDLADLTLEEKAALVTGQNAWQTFEVERLGIPPVWMADGPVGLRKNTGRALTDSVPATCFPSAAAMASTWDPELIERVGTGIGEEARYNEVTLLLGPGLNLKRHPLGGRNFEYYSEDPLLSGLTAAAFVRGVQSTGVGATIKHFAVNNQEYRRMSIDAVVDQRAMRELYLRGFEIAVREGDPAAVMSAYNRINGTYASENPELLNGILRGEWGFAGLVVSDWGAVDDPAAAVAAGLDLEMPGNPLSLARVAEAVRNGTLDAAALDQAVARVLQLVERQAALLETEAVDANDAHHDLARQVATEGMVLLQNDGILPLGGEARIGVVGRLAFEPRIQGIGSSQITTTRIDSPWESLQTLAAAAGQDLASWRTDYPEDGLSAQQRDQLTSFLADRDQLLVFAGQKASHDAEAWDRPSADLAPADLEVLGIVAASGKPFAVILVGGGAMDVRPFAGEANAILMSWLGGQAWGSAVADVLLGVAEPAGRLSETFAWAVEDHASDLNFPGGPHSVLYGEGLYVGYRFFQSYDRPVAYPFGHGLSYTTFEWSEARAPETLDDPQRPIEVRVRVANTGDRVGAETVQVYSRHLDARVPQPDRELVGFTKLRLEPGEAKDAVVEIDPRRLAYWDESLDQWVVAPGSYELLVAASASDIRTTLPLQVTTGTAPRRIYTMGDTVGDIYDDPRGRVVVDLMTDSAGRPRLSTAAEDDFEAAIVRNLTYRKLSNFSQGAATTEMLEQLLGLVNSDMSPEQIQELLRQQMAPSGEGE